MERGTRKGTRKVRNRLSDKSVWNCIAARKEKKKGRTREGIITVVNKEIKEVKVREINKNAMEIRLTHKNKWRIIALYRTRRKQWRARKMK